MPGWFMLVVTSLDAELAGVRRRVSAYKSAQSTAQQRPALPLPGLLAVLNYWISVRHSVVDLLLPAAGRRPADGAGAACGALRGAALPRRGLHPGHRQGTQKAFLSELPVNAPDAGGKFYHESIRTR